MKKPREADANLSYIAEDIRGLALPIATLVPDPKNARSHDKDNLAAIKASLAKFGQRRPIVINVANGSVIEAGNGVYLAATELGWTHLAAVRVHDDPANQTGYALADNRTAELADWNDGVLRELLFQTAEAMPDLYNDLLLHDLLRLPADTAEESDAAGDDADVDDTEAAADEPHEENAEESGAVAPTESGPVLEAYLRAAADSGAIDHSIRVTVEADNSVHFYVHPVGRDGETLDFTVHGNTLFPKKSPG